MKGSIQQAKRVGEVQPFCVTDYREASPDQHATSGGNTCQLVWNGKVSSTLA
jgi:hypothetical protein